MKTMIICFCLFCVIIFQSDSLRIGFKSNVLLSNTRLLAVSEISSGKYRDEEMTF